MSEEQPTPKRRRFTGGQSCGLFLLAAAIAVPGLFWGITLWRDITKTYCSGECQTGWFAVISTFLAVPTFLIGLIIFGIASAIKSKNNKDES